MKIFLLPHHPLDPRYRYCLEREHPLRRRRRRLESRPRNLLARCWDGLQAILVFAKREYDYLVHGHEQIRLSRLVLLMDEDEELTIVIPRGMGQAWALEAVRGVIRSGLMKHRAHVGRNLLTAIFLQLVLVIVVPTHIAGLLFLPLIVLYGVRRYREDCLIREHMEHLLDVRLSNGRHRLLEHETLAQIEQIFQRVPEPSTAYQEAIELLNRATAGPGAEETGDLRAIAHYYRDIGRWDPYERFQDRALRSILRALKRARDEILRGCRWAWNALLRLIGRDVPKEPPAPTPDWDEPYYEDESVRGELSEPTSNPMAGR